MLKKLIFLPTVLIIGLLSCKKNDTKPATTNNSSTSCVLKSIKSDSLNAYFYYDKNDHIIAGAVLSGMQTDSAVFLYDNQGNIIKSLSLSGKDTQSYAVFDLNTSNKISKVHNFNDVTNGVRTESDYEEWTYGTNNRPTKIAVYTNSGSGFALSGYTTYTYDGKGNILTASSYGMANDLQGIETYQYDDKKHGEHINGNIDDATNDNVNNVTDDLFKDATGKVLSHFKNTYDYDSNGNPVKETDTDDSGAKTVYVYTYSCK